MPSLLPEEGGAATAAATATAAAPAPASDPDEDPDCCFDVRDLAGGAGGAAAMDGAAAGGSGAGADRPGTSGCAGCLLLSCLESHAFHNNNNKTRHNTNYATLIF